MVEKLRKLVAWWLAILDSPKVQSCLVDGPDHAGSPRRIYWCIQSSRCILDQQYFLNLPGATRPSSDDSSRCVRLVSWILLILIELTVRKYFKLRVTGYTVIFGKNLHHFHSFYATGRFSLCIYNIYCICFSIFSPFPCHPSPCTPLRYKTVGEPQESRSILWQVDLEIGSVLVGSNYLLNKCTRNLTGYIRIYK